MKLFNAALQAASITGNVENFNSTINQPLMGAKCFEDRLTSYYYQVRLLACTGNEEKAFQQCLIVLGQCGEVFSPEVTPQLIYRDIIKTKALLNGYSREDFLNLPRVDKNSTEYWQIKMWKMAMILSFHLNTQFAPLIGCRIIQLSSEYGWSPDSAFGLYAFAHALICVLEDVEEGYFWYV